MVEVPVAESSVVVEAVAEAAEPETVAFGEMEIPADVMETINDVLNTDATAEATEVVETIEAAEVVTEAVAIEAPKTEMKEVQSGQIMMLVIAGVSLLLGAIAVFCINTRRKE